MYELTMSVDGLCKCIETRNPLNLHKPTEWLREAWHFLQEMRLRSLEPTAMSTSSRRMALGHKGPHWRLRGEVARAFAFGCGLLAQVLVKVDRTWVSDGGNQLRTQQRGPPLG